MKSKGVKGCRVQINLQEEFEVPWHGTRSWSSAGDESQKLTTQCSSEGQEMTRQIQTSCRTKRSEGQADDVCDTTSANKLQEFRRHRSAGEAPILYWARQRREAEIIDWASREMEFVYRVR